MGALQKPCACPAAREPRDAPWPQRHPPRAFPGIAFSASAEKILIREPYASLQRKLLESEGVTIVESRVDLKRHLWKPPRKIAVKSSPRKRVSKVTSQTRRLLLSFAKRTSICGMLYALLRVPAGEWVVSEDGKFHSAS